MSIRKATPNDLDAVIHIFKVCLHENALSQFIYPYRHTYPEDYEEALLSAPKRKLLTEPPEITKNIVLENQNGDIVGWACWRRNVAQPGSKPMGKGPTHLNMPTNTGNRSLSPDRSRRFMNGVDGDNAKFFSNNHWYLSMLAVLPDQQRKGYGRQLCVWGMKGARDDGVECALTASEHGEMLYRNLGWKRVGFRSPPDFEGMNMEVLYEEFGRESELFTPLPVLKWGVDGEGYDELDRDAVLTKQAG